MEYGYIAGYSHDFCSDTNLLTQLKAVLKWNIAPNLIYMDKFTGHCKERFALHELLCNVVQEGDIITVANLYNLYSNVRELTSIMNVAENKGIILNSNDMDYSRKNSVDEWFLATQLCHLEYIDYIHKMQRQKNERKAKYQRLINIGGRNKRVITNQYRQAYNYLQQHTYKQTQSKFNLSKSTLYRIKQQLDN